MRKLLLISVGVVGMGIASCDPRGAEVPLPQTGASLEGTVYLGDKVVANAMVIAVRAGAGGGSAQAFSDGEGNYKLENVPTGQVKLGVNTEASKGMMMGKAMAGVDQSAKGKLGRVKVTEVPRKYHDPMSSGLTADVADRGPTKHDIHIK